MTMLESIKERGKHIGMEISRTLDGLSEGWRELLSRSNASLTHFARSKDEGNIPIKTSDQLPRWGLLASELEETGDDVLVRVELPGLNKEDCEITVEGNMLCIRGQRRFESATTDSTFHVMERAYGSFQRTIALPRHVLLDSATASFANGVLTVRLPKDGKRTQERKIVVS
jgi:HSP20 family protein